MFGREKGNRERSALVLRGKIIGMHLSGSLKSAISEWLGIHRSTVSRWIKLFQEENDLSTRPKNGRPKLTTAEHNAQIIQLPRANPKQTTVAINREMQLPISVRSVRRILNANGLRHRTPSSNEEITKNNRNDRLMFAAMHE